MKRTNFCIPSAFDDGHLTLRFQPFAAMEGGEKRETSFVKVKNDKWRIYRKTYYR